MAAQVGGPPGVLLEANVACAGPDASHCKNGSAALALALQPDRYGNLTIKVTLRDDGGVARGGVDATPETVSVVARPVNDPPAFSTFVSTVTILESSSCVTMGRAYGEWEAPGQVNPEP